MKNSDSLLAIFLYKKTGFFVYHIIIKIVYVNGIQKNIKKFTCINCAFVSRNKYNYNRHIATRKYKNALNGNNVYYNGDE